MSELAGVLFVTGIAAHSLGETFLKLHLPNEPTARMIGADLYPPSKTLYPKQLSIFPFDLNPLSSPSGYTNFASDLRIALDTALEQVRGDHVNCLVQAAGVYDFGKFLDHDVARRKRILGVNLLGHVEVLHAVMSLNAKRGIDNATALTHIDIGSFQGLYARAERPVYASSKAAGIDFDGAMFEGRELARSVYFAPAAIDTHMLHFNHWIKKARGSEKLFECVREGDRNQYEEIFIHCNADALREASIRYGVSVDEAVRTFKKYVVARREAFDSALGVLSVDVCARMLRALVTNPDEYPSGVYLAYAPNGTAAKLLFTEFSQLSRLAIVEALGRSKHEW